MNKVILIAISIFGSYGFADDPKVDWSICSKEVSATCAAKKDDHATHECLEKLPKAKISKECAEFNHKLDAKFKDKHGDHKH